MKKSIFTLAFVTGISLLGFSQTEGRIVGVGQAGDAYEQQADQVADKTIGMPIGAGPSGTTAKVYIVESLDGSGMCVTLPTNEQFQLDELVEIEAKSTIGGGVNGDWITNTSAIRTSGSLTHIGSWEQASYITNTCAIRMSKKESSGGIMLTIPFGR